MPSTLPTISVRTSPDNIVKIKEIAKYHGRSVSNEVERLIEDHIAKFEKEHGVITIYNMTPGEIIEDIKDRIASSPPYGDKQEELEENIVKEMYDRFEDYQDKISLEEFKSLLSRCIVKRKGKTYIEQNVLKDKIQTLYVRKEKLDNEKND